MARFAAFASICLLTAGCTSSSFSGETGRGGKPTVPPKPDTADANEHTGGDDEPASSDSEQPKNQSNSSKKNDNPSVGVDAQGAPCLNELVPSNVMIALDVSTSMTTQIETIKKNLAGLGDQIKTIKPAGSNDPIKDVNLGLITFVDNASSERHYPLTSDFPTLTQSISRIGVQDDGNIDMPEGGLQAALHSLEALQSKAQGAKKSVPILLVITDNFAHTGTSTPGGREFASPAIRQLLAKPEFDHFLLYDSVPNADASDLDGFDDFDDDFDDDGINLVSTAAPQGSPADQWLQIRADWQADRPQVKVAAGAYLGYPFSTDTLLKELPAAISKSLKLCN